jgi:hypothetical protein
MRVVRMDLFFQNTKKDLRVISLRLEAVKIYKKVFRQCVVIGLLKFDIVINVRLAKHLLSAENNPFCAQANSFFYRV